MYLKRTQQHTVIQIHLLLACCFSATLSNAQSDADSIVYNGKTLYILDEPLNVNGYSIPDSFTYEQAVAQIGIPDSVMFGGPEIIEEFGVDDYWLYYDRSVINAGHGSILLIEVLDESLAIDGIRIGDSRKTVKQKLNKNFPDRDKIEFITSGDDILGFIFETDGKLVEMYYWRPL